MSINAAYITNLVLVCVLIVLSIQARSAFGLTVKTNHTDVNLWDGAGRESNRTIGEIRRFEEVEVKGRKTVSGDTWYQVSVVRYVKGKKTTQTGWVDSSYFNKIEDPTEEDQPDDSVSEARASCVNCATQSKQSRRIPLKIAADEGSPSVSSRQGFQWPVTGTLRSGFGYRRHPIKRVVKLHRGTDISGNNGKPVRAAKGGIVETSAGGCKTGRMSCNEGAGNMVVINHGDGTKTRYLHLNPKCSLPKQGSRISQDTVLGCVGATGGVTGPHLHFEVIQNGKFINPLTVLPKRRR